MKYIILSVLFMACDYKAIEAHNTRFNNSEVNSMSYHKDPRTNLCFAAYHLGGNSAAITNVPCTSEVEKFIK